MKKDKQHFQNKQADGFKLLKERLIIAGVYDDRLTGKIAYYSQLRGFGFIMADEKKYFFHISNFFGQSGPEQGQLVTFETQPGKKGLDAVNVRPSY